VTGTVIGVVAPPPDGETEEPVESAAELAALASDELAASGEYASAAARLTS